MSEQDQVIKAHPGITIYRDYELLLQDKKIDAVYIALPHKFHYEWIMKAIQYKKAILCEKPAVLTVKEMKEIKNAVQEHQVPFLEALKTKMNIGFFHLLEDLHLIGEIKHIVANFCFDTTSSRDTKAYHYERGQGGALNDIGSYLVGFVLKIVNEPVVKIKSDVQVYRGVDEHFRAMLEFKGGAIADIEGAFDETKERLATITGTKGGIIIPMYNRMSEYTISLHSGEKVKKEYPIGGDDMTYQIEVLHQCIKDKRIESQFHSLDESIDVIEVMERIRNAWN